MRSILHIVEPTLNDKTGHCYSFVSSLLEASRGRDVEMEIWMGRRAAGLFEDCPAVRAHPVFFSHFRRIQLFFVCRSLLAQPGRVFLPTAGRTDMLLLNWAARKAIPESKLFLFFHWFRATPGKLEFLRKTAKRHPNLVILAPTDGILQVFRDCGFERCQRVPYPITKTGASEGEAAEPSFQRVLFAGAARQDKGFRHVVNLVEHLASNQARVPVSIQVSEPHSGKHDPETQQDLLRLNGIDYAPMERQKETLDEAEYQRLFRGSICLQLYDRQDFADRVSAVTLDALSAGAPIVCTSGTWIARVVERFGAGVAVQEESPQVVLSAIQQVSGDYPDYYQRAKHAGEVLQRENSASHLMEVLMG
jgi:hypothetical protein